MRESNIDADIVLEPMRRDSGPAVAVAANRAGTRSPGAGAGDGTDHVIRKPENYTRRSRAAVAAAEGRIVTSVSNQPIPRQITAILGPASNQWRVCRTIDAFVEKPDARRPNAI